MENPTITDIDKPTYRLYTIRNLKIIQSKKKNLRID